MQTLRQLFDLISARRRLSDSLKDGNGPPQLSRGGAIVVTLAVALICAAFTAWQVYAILKVQHETEAKALQERFELVFSSVAEDLKRLAQSPAIECTPGASQELARQSLRSEFARGFYFAQSGSSILCGPLGKTEPFLDQIESESNTEDFLRQDASVPNKSAEALFRVSGLQRLRPSVLMKHIGPTGANLWAEIPASGLLAETSASRTSSRDQRSAWSLMDPHGNAILRQGPKGLDASYTLRSQESVSNLYGYRFAIFFSVEQFKTRLIERAMAWAIVSLLLSFALIKAINQHFGARMSPERKMKMAIRKRQIEPVIQPIVSLESGECLGGEVLMRWKHPVRGLIPPSEFISLAEQNGMIIPMSEMLMRKARDQLAELQNSSMYFSFNITAAQLRDPMFPHKILGIFDGAGLPPKTVVLELTEREAIGEHDGEILGRLRELGFRIAIDDFGTGQSSLSMLQGLQIDRIKIDREFVRTIDESTERRPVLDTIIVLAKELAVPVIAEGIETQAQWDYLANRKVEAAQGYLIAKPMLIADFIKWLETRDIRIANKPARPEGRLGSKDRRDGTRQVQTKTLETVE
jgi:sensor c-di-GMP phosphodiesterase-like protein